MVVLVEEELEVYREIARYQFFMFCQEFLAPGSSGAMAP